MMDKRAFMDACREGGPRIEAALRALDVEFATVLYRDCRKAVRSEGQADDLVQETFIKVWQRCATFRGDSELLGWVRSILRRTIIDFFRATKPEEPMEDDEGEMTHEVQVEIGRQSAEARNAPPDLVSRGQAEAVYRRCFAAFEADHPEHAAVMRWIAEEGMANAEIEELLGRSPGATRQFISQCRKKSRVYLDEWYQMMREQNDD